MTSNKMKPVNAHRQTEAILLMNSFCNKSNKLLNLRTDRDRLNLIFQIC